MDDDSSFKAKLLAVVAVIAVAVGAQLWWNRAHSTAEKGLPGKQAASQPAQNNSPAKQSNGSTNRNPALLLEAVNFKYTPADDTWTEVARRIVGEEASIALVRPSTRTSLSIKAFLVGPKTLDEKEQLVELNRNNHLSWMQHATYSPPQKRKAGSLEGVQLELTGAEEGKSAFALAWICTTNGYRCVLILEGRDADPKKLKEDSERAFAGLELIDPARKATPKETATKEATPVPDAGHESDPELVNSLKMLIDQGHTDLAATQLEKCLQTKDTLELRLVQAYLLRQQQKFTEALAVLKEQEKRNSFSPKVSREIIECRYSAGQYKEALDECARLIGKGHDSADARIAKGRNELALKDYRQARVSLEMALEKDPRNPEAQKYLQLIPGKK